jgi:hypothetical protein
MNREIHVRFCGGLEVKLLRSTRRPTYQISETVRLTISIPTMVVKVVQFGIDKS